MASAIIIMQKIIDFQSSMKIEFEKIYQTNFWKDLPSLSVDGRRSLYDLPSNSGIYFVSQDELLLYVGKATCIKGRWISDGVIAQDHALVDSILKMDQIKISWLICKDPIRSTAETIFIAGAEPLWNRRGNIKARLAPEVIRGFFRYSFLERRCLSWGP